MAWLNINYPSSALSKSPSVNLSTGNSSGPSLSLTAVSNPSVTPPSTLSSSVTSSDVLDELLVLPEPQRPKTSRRKKQGINIKAVCITHDEVLDDMKKNDAEKAEVEALKTRKRMKREKKKEREEKMEKKMRDLKTK